MQRRTFLIALNCKENLTYQFYINTTKQYNRGYPCARSFMEKKQPSNQRLDHLLHYYKQLRT